VLEHMTKASKAMTTHTQHTGVSACVLQAKQNSELVGRSIFLRLTRAGRVESVEGSGSAEAVASDAGADTVTDSPAKEAAVLDKTDLVLMGECGQLLRELGQPGS
jgi:hypothetical protein